MKWTQNWYLKKNSLTVEVGKWAKFGLIKMSDEIFRNWTSFVWLFSRHSVVSGPAESAIERIASTH